PSLSAAVATIKRSTQGTPVGQSASDSHTPWSRWQVADSQNSPALQSLAPRHGRRRSSTHTPAPAKAAPPACCAASGATRRLNVAPPSLQNAPGSQSLLARQRSDWTRWQVAAPPPPAFGPQNSPGPQPPGFIGLHVVPRSRMQPPGGTKQTPPAQLASSAQVSPLFVQTP